MLHTVSSVGPYAGLSDEGQARKALMGKCRPRCMRCRLPEVLSMDSIQLALPAVWHRAVRARSWACSSACCWLLTGTAGVVTSRLITVLSPALQTLHTFGTC